jgi:NADH:ubiquinone oxidoreductase subunit 6 (subunit J)
MSPDQANNLLQFHPLDTVPLWALYIGAVVVLLLAVEVSYRLSKALQRRRPDKAESSVGALSGATLALLAFLLAFVTSTAVNSLTARRQAVVEEANAIGTAYLRAGYLPEPTATESRQLLREYVDQRLAALDRAKIAQAISRSEEIHSELWTRAEALAREESSPTLALYVSALNDVIDLHTERINVELVARVPWAIVLGLFLMAVLAMGLVGLHAGYAENRNLIALVAFVLTLSVVFLLIVDLSRSQSGLLQVSYQAMIDLQRQLNVQL